ncbi:hypothetical protein RAS1_36940 [Phycisphaerae bacterium RAS1]|nr:hypothetical protein RAS1_36940 [Phycisphaerae bacterium RAS1]
MAKKSAPSKKPAKVAAKPASRAVKPAKASPAGVSAKRLSWLDASGKSSQIDTYAKNMKSFIDAMADGKVDQHEVADQERRLVALMKKLEPKLDDAAHAAVTELLCEMAVYDLMQVLHSMYAARPQTAFRG